MVIPSGLLPGDITAELLARWREPHRRYHGTGHLSDGLAALGRLGGGRLERIAFWFHDAVHTNTSPADEIASAGLAEELLTGRLPGVEIAEVRRLVLLTATHHSEPGDEAGQRICDADLHALAAPWERYRGNVMGIRAELTRLPHWRWNRKRRAFLEAYLGRERLFQTRLGAELWESAARENMARELNEIPS